MTTVLVTGAGGSAAHNFIDSLKLCGSKYRLIGVDTDPHHLALSNAGYRYVAPPHLNVSAYLTFLNRLIDKYQVDLVHPQPDPEVAFLGHHRRSLHAPTFLPKNSTIAACHHKMAAIATLSKAGVPVARSYLLTRSQDIDSAFHDLSPAGQTVWVRAIRGAGSKAALPVSQPSEAKAWIAYWHNHKGIGFGEFMLSEFLPGKEFAFQSLWSNGRLIVSQARERCEYVFGNLTPSGQSSSPSVAVTVNRDDVNDIATGAVKAIDPKATGIFCVDLKENRQGTPCVIEINPGRFFTTSNFFAHAGCNMPDVYVRLALGETLPKLPRYNALKAGLYWLRTIDMGYKLIDGDWGLDEL